MTTLITFQTKVQMLQITDDGEESCGAPYTHMVVLYILVDDQWVCFDDIQFESLLDAKVYFLERIESHLRYDDPLSIN